MTKAVLLVTFNRKAYLQKVFAAVAAAKPPRLYLSSDGPRQNKVGEAEVVSDIRNWMLANVNWPCEVKTRFLEVNSGGCGPGVSGAITWFFQNEKDGIIIEDDCVPSPTFFDLCEECLDRYVDDKRIWIVCGNTPVSTRVNASYFFGSLPLIWGWATWADRWAQYDYKKWKYNKDIFDHISSRKQVKDYYASIMDIGAEGKIETWDYQWSFTVFSHKGLCIVPKQNLVSNCGLVGVHYSLSEDDSTSYRINTPVSIFPWIVHPQTIKLHKRNNERILQCFCPTTPRFNRIKNKTYEILSKALKTMLPQFLVVAIRQFKNR